MIVVVSQGTQELIFIEIRPVGFAGVQHGASALPEQEIRQAHLSRRAYDEIRMGLTGRIEVLLDEVFTDVVRRSFLTQNLADGVRDFRTTAVVEGDVEDHIPVVTGEFDRFADVAPCGRRQSIQRSQVPQLDAFFVQFRKLAFQKGIDERDQAFDLLLRSPPILGGKSVDGHVTNSVFPNGTDDAAQILDAGAMTGVAR